MLNTKILERIQAWNFSEAVCAIDDDVTFEEKYLLKSLDKFVGDSMNSPARVSSNGSHCSLGALIESLVTFLLKQYEHE